MKTVEVTYKIDGIERTATYRTNNSGAYLFTGVSENRQIDCVEGYDNPRRMREAIRAHILGNAGYDAIVGRISYDWSRY